MQGRDKMLHLADRVTAIQTARRADVAENGSDSNSLNFGLCEVVYEWAKGRVGERKASMNGTVLIQTISNPS